eukprot:1027778-Rhodomonas_salina.1
MPGKVIAESVKFTRAKSFLSPPQVCVHFSCTRCVLLASMLPRAARKFNARPPLTRDGTAAELGRVHADFRRHGIRQRHSNSHAHRRRALGPRSGVFGGDPLHDDDRHGQYPSAHGLGWSQTPRNPAPRHHKAHEHHLIPRITKTHDYPTQEPGAPYCESAPDRQSFV